MTTRTRVPRYCVCGWSDDLPDDEHRHDERIREGQIKAAGPQGWAHHERQVREATDG